MKKKKETKNNVHKDAILGYLQVIEDHLQPKLETLPLGTKIRLEGALTGLKHEVEELIKHED